MYKSYLNARQSFRVSGRRVLRNYGLAVIAFIVCGMIASAFSHLIAMSLFSLAMSCLGYSALVGAILVYENFRFEQKRPTRERIMGIVARSDAGEAITEDEESFLIIQEARLRYELLAGI